MDWAAFDEIMRRQSVPMIIVTTAVGVERAGCLVGFHAQCSIDPDRYAVWLSKANHTCQVALRATHFGLHFLDRRHRDLAELFGTRCSAEVDKFARTRFHIGMHDVPVLEECRDRVIARRTSFLEEGSDHICFITEPVEATAGEEREPLRFADVADLRAAHEAQDRSARGGSG